VPVILWWMDHIVTNAGDYDGDGRLDQLTAENVYGDKMNIIILE
jgi:hypothetical protein